MPKIREIIREEYNSDGQFMPPNPWGIEVSVGREMEGGDDQDMQMDLQADLTTNPILAFPIDEADISLEKGNQLIPAILQRLGHTGQVKFEGEGEDGIAFSVGNKVYKLTRSVSEVNDSVKIKGKRNAHLADVYGVYQIKGQNMYVIILEKLRTDKSKFAKLEDSTIQILNDIFGVKRKRYENWAMVFGSYKDNRALYDNKFAYPIAVGFAKYPQEKQFYDSILKILDELKKNNVQSMDIVYTNLGYKPNGNIAFFDLGKGGDNTQSNVDTLKLAEMVMERVMSYMPKSSAVAVKKKCQLGGNGDGTSTACNQGDINALVMTSIKEEIDGFHRSDASNELAQMSENDTDDKVGKEFWFEYHCNESDCSPDAPVWYRSHQKVKVLSITEPGIGDTPLERGEDGAPRVYRVRFQDGLEWDVFEDELLNSPEEFERPNPPQKPTHIREVDVYHGTRSKKFNKFSNKKIGSGDGREIGGWGYYFTDSPDVASIYGDKILNVELKDGKFLNLDETLDDELASAILTKGRKFGISDEDLEQFRTDFYDEQYRYDVTNKQAYEWLTHVLGTSKAASMFLLKVGYVGNMMHDKVHPEATNYIVFDPSFVKIMSNGDEDLYEIEYVDTTGGDQELVGMDGSVPMPNDSTYIPENVQMLNKYLLKTGKISEEDKNNILSITRGDNYTYFIGMTYLFFFNNKKTPQERTAEFNNPHMKNSLKEYYDDVKNYDPNVFPIQNYDPYLKNIHHIDMLECLSARRYCVNAVSKIPSVYLRNLREDIRLPRDRNEMKYGLENDLKEIRASMKQMERLSPEKQEMYYKKMFSSQFSTFKEVKNNLENLNVLFLSHDEGIDEIRRKIPTAVKWGDAKLLYDRENIIVLDIFSSDGMKEFGCGSTWCFAIEGGDQYWKDYGDNSHVNIIYNFNLDPEDKLRMCVYLPTGELYNMYNEPVEGAYDYLDEIGVSRVLNAQKKIRRKPAVAFNEVNVAPTVLNEGKDQKVEYGALMLNFKITNWKEITNMIKKDDVYDKPTFGIETKPHVTILYGFHTNVTAAQVKEIVEKIVDLKTPIEIQLSELSFFEVEGQDYDVVKFDVKAPILHKLNRALRKLPHTSSFPDYHPHMTLSYVTKGNAKKYAQKLKKSIKLQSNTIVYSTKNEKKTKLNENKQFNMNLLPFKDEIQQAGGKIYSVGGAVRDGLLNKPSKDLDLLITGIPMDKLEQILSKYGRTDNVGKSFGIIKFNDPKLGELDIAIPRTEKANGQGGYQGFDVSSDHSLPIEKDLERRDFTINAMAKDLEGNMVDPYGGQQDLNAKMIRMVNPDAFKDDPLRMIRAVQFASRFGFEIEPKTMAAIKENASRIREISPERILIEFDKIVKKGDPVLAAKLLADSGLYENIFGVPPRINYEEMKKVKTMGEFIYLLSLGVGSSPSEFFRTTLKGDNDTINEIRALEMAYSAPAKPNDVQTKLAIYNMFKTYPKALESQLIPHDVKLNIAEMQKAGMPFSLKQLAINGNDLLMMGYTGQQIGEFFRKVLVDIYAGKLRNNRELLLNYLTPKEEV